MGWAVGTKGGLAAPSSKKLDDSIELPSLDSPSFLIRPVPSFAVAMASGQCPLSFALAVVQRDCPLVFSTLVPAASTFLPIHLSGLAYLPPSSSLPPSSPLNPFFLDIPIITFNPPFDLQEASQSGASVLFPPSPP